MDTQCPQTHPAAFDPRRERDFYEIFGNYYDFEKGASRRPDAAVYSLDRMIPVAEAAGNPEEHLAIIHVAGTKGKGSTCAFLAGFLAASGTTCGLFSSPHLCSVRERFQINGVPVDYDELLEAAAAFEARIRNAGLHPSLFEVMTVFALRLFADRGCAWCVLETGIGGVLDATNYIPSPRCTVITPISLDHQELLGNTVEKVAFQKAGIIKPHVPVVCGTQPYPEAEAVVLRRADEARADFHAVEEATDPADWGILPAPPFTIENFHLAHTVCRVLSLPVDPARFVPPVLCGRFQVLRERPPVVIDAAHNADSARRLAEAIRIVYPAQRFTVVLGVVRGKDVEGIVRELSVLEADFILTNPRPPKESALEQLRECAEANDLAFRLCPDITALAHLEKAAEDPLLFTGSFFTALIGVELFEKSEQSGLRSEETPV